MDHLKLEHNLIDFCLRNIKDNQLNITVYHCYFDQSFAFMLENILDDILKSLLSRIALICSHSDGSHHPQRFFPSNVGRAYYARQTSSTVSYLLPAKGYNDLHMCSHDRSNCLFKTEEGEALCCLSCLTIEVFRRNGTIA